MTVCIRCGEQKYITDFYKSSRNKSGREGLCKTCRAEMARTAYHKNIDQHRKRRRGEKYKAARKRWTEANQEKVKKYINTWFKTKWKNDPEFRLRSLVHSRIWRTLNGKSVTDWCIILGYSVHELRENIEGKFTEGMSWDNHGEWHIDHIRPVSSFNIVDENDEELKKCWSLDNLQPLWATDNMVKGNRVMA